MLSYFRSSGISPLLHGSAWFSATGEMEEINGCLNLCVDF